MFSPKSDVIATCVIVLQHVLLGELQMEIHTLPSRITRNKEWISEGLNEGPSQSHDILGNFSFSLLFSQILDIKPNKPIEVTTILPKSFQYPVFPSVFYFSWQRTKKTSNPLCHKNALSPGTSVVVRQRKGVQQRAEKIVGDLRYKTLAYLACICRTNAFSTFESIEHILFKLQKYKHWVTVLVISN